MKITIECDDREQEVIENFNNIIVLTGTIEDQGEDRNISIDTYANCDTIFLYNSIFSL